MRPALSIIVFTTMSGLGYGLAIVLSLSLLDPAAMATKAAYVIALALIGGGLLSSTLHLGNPQRAWRALTQWRSSWLSREGVLAILTFIPLCVLAYAAIFEDRHLTLVGTLGAAMSLVTVYSTAMIYASLKSVDAWHTPLTPAVYLLMALAGGFVAGTVIAAIGGGFTVLPGALALLFLAAAWIVKLAWRHRLVSQTPLSTPESATGLGYIGRVRQFEPPHFNENYLTHEMGFRIARKHAAKLFTFSIVAGGAVPFVLIALALPSGGGAGTVILASLALISHMIGVVVERWLFFAEARHAVMIYYSDWGAISSRGEVNRASSACGTTSIDRDFRTPSLRRHR